MKRELPKTFTNNKCTPKRAGDTVGSLVDAYLYNLSCLSIKDRQIETIERWGNGN